MNERITTVIKHLGVTQANFCAQIGVNPAIMSHIQKGRNKPSLELVMKILQKFPEISSDWLLFGKGEMIKKKETSTQSDKSPSDVTIEKVPKPVERITIFYEDGTYCNFYAK